jgi:hypothetical protein
MDPIIVYSNSQSAITFGEIQNTILETNMLIPNTILREIFFLKNKFK